MLQQEQEKIEERISMDHEDGVAVSSLSEKNRNEKNVESLIVEADRAWKEGRREFSIETYERALRIVRAKKDLVKEGMVCLGVGFAMMNLEDDGEAEKAIPYLRRSFDIAKDHGEKRQEDFLRHLIEGVETRRKRVKAGTVESKDDELSETPKKSKSETASELASRAFEKVSGIDLSKTKDGGGCCGGKSGDEGESVEKHGVASKASIEREIRRAASDILGTTTTAAPAVGGVNTIAVSSENNDDATWKNLGFDDLNSEDSNRFVRLVRQRLGDAFQFPPAETLLKTCSTVSELASYIMEHCPVDGNCSACPAKHRCEAHADESKECADIEDVMESACARKAASSARGSSTKRKSTSKAKARHTRVEGA